MWRRGKGKATVEGDGRGRGSWVPTPAQSYAWSNFFFYRFLHGYSFREPHIYKQNKCTYTNLIYLTFYLVYLLQ